MQEPLTAWQAVVAHAERDPDRTFLNQPVEGEVISWTFGEAVDNARRFASALRGMGLEKGDRVAILSKNVAEWLLADYAIMMAGLISVPIYPTAGAATIRHVMRHSEAKAVIVGKLDDPDIPKQALATDIPKIALRYPSMDCQYEWQSLIESHEPWRDYHEPDAAETMTILYTSGSTGQPKGVVISYRAYNYASQTTRDILEVDASDRMLSYLPLAHITERSVIAGPAAFAGSELFFAESLATFRTDMKRANPTAFVSVPRLWVQFQAGVHAKIPPAKLNLLLSLPIVGRKVARKVREELGLADCRLVGSGSAPISPLTLKWYEKLGVNISEGWGMSETSGLSCGNNPFSSSRVGTIGVPLPGTEMKLTDDGEILLKSPGLFTEYYKQPELTAEVFSDDGFFHTGDKGEWDETLQAFRITGRVKDQFKSAKGKYVTPVPIEGKLSGNPLFEQVCVMGSGLRAPVALTVLSPVSKGMEREEIEHSLVKTLGDVNETLESHEKMSNIFIVDEPWTIENDLLTPTLKIKRDKLESKYGQLISEPRNEKVVWP
ncbi:MAG: AMP-binding protein [Gammaproteobacteria bacterium]|nr:AMP-binding protein [Gammaproteobacteria bacterium]